MIYKIIYTPASTWSGESFVNASSEHDAVRLAGAGLPAWGKTLVAVREVPENETKIFSNHRHSRHQQFGMNGITNRSANLVSGIHKTRRS